MDVPIFYSPTWFSICLPSFDLSRLLWKNPYSHVCCVPRDHENSGQARWDARCQSLCFAAFSIPILYRPCFCFDCILPHLDCFLALRGVLFGFVATRSWVLLRIVVSIFPPLYFPYCFIQFMVCQQPRIGCDPGAVEFRLQTAVETHFQAFIL